MLKPFKRKGFRQFVIRTSIFFVILLAIQLSIFLYFSKTGFFRTYLAIPTIFYFEFLQGLSKQDFLNSAIFVIVAFFLWRREDIFKLHSYKQDYKQTLIFSILALSSLLLHYLFKYWIVTNLSLTLRYVILIILIKYTLNILFVVFLALSIYNLNFIRFFIKKFYIDMIFFTIILVLYYKIIEWFQDSWLFFSTVVGKILYFIFSKFFDNVTFRISSQAGPILGVEDFKVGISKVCSGIDSLLFFISLFTILFVLNWKELDKKRMMLLLIPGLIGTFILNIARVFLIVLIAIKISPELAVDLFHTNAGWVLFLGYFIIFWHFGSKWVLRND